MKNEMSKIATEIISRSTGSHIVRHCWSVSATNAMANHCLDLVSADDAIGHVEAAETVRIEDVDEAEAIESYMAAPGNEASAADYAGIEYVKIIVTTEARGMLPGSRAEYIAPNSGW